MPCSTAAAMLGVAITLSPINPIKALYWTAVINGVVAVPGHDGDGRARRRSLRDPMGKFHDLRLAAGVRLGVDLGDGRICFRQRSSAGSLSLVAAKPVKG